MIQNAPETPRFRQLEFTVHQQPPDTHSANSVYVLFTVLEDSTELQLSSETCYNATQTTLTFY